MEQKETMWEQRLGAVMQVVVAASLLWIGSSVVDMRTELSVLKVQVVSLGAQVPQVTLLLQQIKDLEYQNRELTRRLDSLEIRNGVSTGKR